MRLLALALCMLAALPARSDTNSDLDNQRAMFIKAYEQAELGIWELSPQQIQSMKTYVLWPDLRGKYLEKTLETRSAETLEQFFSRHPGTSATRALRYRWSLYLYKSKRWSDYLDIYKGHYSKLSNTRLDCMAVHSQIKAGQTINGVMALDLWRVGKSQPAECDEVFSWLEDNGLLDRAQVRQRFQLALDAREFNLAAWLAKRLDKADAELAKRWKRLRDAPLKALQTYDANRAGVASRKEIAYGFERYARADTEGASDLWQTVQKQFRFPPEQAAAVAEQIALVAAWRHEPYTEKLIQRVAVDQRSDELLEWQARDALRRDDWVQVGKAIALMSPELAGSERWQYWRAQAYLANARADAANALLETLAKKRSYHGFLAADLLGVSYSYMHEALVADEAIAAKLAAMPQLIRARELFLVGLSGRARSEWDAHTKGFSNAEKAQAALLASNWDWHSRAISTAASGGHFDDLHLRYPLPWQTTFIDSASRNKIDAGWALGIARSESIFMRDVRSGAGAIGLMQLMPATGKATAKAAKIRYRGRASLTDPETNIQLGTRYLADMYKRFNNSQVLATAAYNAGPHRVVRWIDGVQDMPATIWIETIPFDETRKYVQRVLEANAVFHWRLTEKTRRLSQVLSPIADTSKQASLKTDANRTSG